MNKFSGKHNHWDEFRWERELRRDERRISGYFRQLANCLDLPDEEELIYGQLSANCEMVPSANDALKNWFFEHDCDDEFDDHERQKRTPSTNVIDDLDALNTYWNLLYASRLRSDCHWFGLGINCAFAKLLACAADFTEPEQECSRELLICLGKRALAGLNDLAGAFRVLAPHQKSLAPEIDYFLSHLSAIREQLLCSLENIRQTKL